jgi:hypothetical protein
MSAIGLNLGDHGSTCDQHLTDGSAHIRGITRRLKAGWRRGDRLLCLDWTLLRLFPPLRATWALKGRQAVVPITGRNAKRVLCRSQVARY